MNIEKSLQQFQVHLTAELGYSQGTARSYTYDIKLLFDYLIENNNYGEIKDIELNKIEKIDIKSFLNDMVVLNDIEFTTRNRRLASLKSYFKFLIDYEVIKDTNNPTKNIKTTKIKKNTKPVYLTHQEVEKYLNTIRNYESKFKIKQRDLAINMVMLYAGLRVSEVTNLKLKNINFEEKILKFTGKGNKERIIPINNKLYYGLEKYINDERNYYLDEDLDLVFISKQKTPITPRAIQMQVKKYSKMANISKKITPHKLRHTFATNIYQQTQDIRTVQQLLGHTDISTTQIYTHIDREKKESAVDSISY